MSKYLFIGDMHVEPHDIEDATKLIDYAVQICLENRVERIVFLGDQFHTHSIIHSSVLKFWKDSFAKFYDIPKILLVGNHDRPNDSNAKEHSLIAFNQLNDNCYVVDNYDDGGYEKILYIGYQHKKEDFLRIVNEYKDTVKTVVCHQEFNGAIYENGFYAKHGIMLEDIPDHIDIISGHIHRKQTIGRLQYFGSPRWKSLNDANEEKYLTLCSQQNGRFKIEKLFPTSKVCKTIQKLSDNENEPLDISKIDFTQKIHIDIHGTKSYINKRKVEFENHGASIRSFQVKERVITVKESEGISKSFNKYVDEFNPPNGTPKDKLLQLVSERIVW